MSEGILKIDHGVASPSRRFERPTQIVTVCAACHKIQDAHGRWSGDASRLTDSDEVDFINHVSARIAWSSFTASSLR